MSTWYKHKLARQLAGREHAGNILRTRRGLVRAFQETGSSNACLLFGYAGAGKSSLVDSALLEDANAAGRSVDVVEINCTALVSSFPGAGGAVTALHDLRERFTHNAPDLRVFVFDEADAVGPQRDRADSAHQALCHFCMDCLNDRAPPAFWLLITNLPDLLDMAILSRVGRRLYLPCPDRDAARLIMATWIENPEDLDLLLGELFDGPPDDVVTTRGLVESMAELEKLGAFPERRLRDTPSVVADSLRANAGFPGRAALQNWEANQGEYIRNSDLLLSLWGI